VYFTYYKILIYLEDSDLSYREMYEQTKYTSIMIPKSFSSRTTSGLEKNKHGSSYLCLPKYEVRFHSFI